MQDIEEKAQAGSLLSSDLFNEYLYLRKYARGDEGPREYLVSVIGTEQGLSELLRSYITKTSLVFEGWIEKPEAGEHSELRVQPLEDFGLVDEARARAEGLLHEHPEWLSDNDRRLLRAFISYYLPGKGA